MALPLKSPHVPPLNMTKPSISLEATIAQLSKGVHSPRIGVFVVLLIRGVA